MSHLQTKIEQAAIWLSILVTAATAEDEWLQSKYHGMHSGNVPDRTVAVPLGLAGTAPLTDAIFTAPVVAAGCAYVVDGSSEAFCIDAETLRRAYLQYACGIQQPRVFCYTRLAGLRLIAGRDNSLEVGF